MKAKILRAALPISMVVAASAIYWSYHMVHAVEGTLAVTVEKSNFTFDQYFNADYQHARAAMLDQINRLDGLSVGSVDKPRNPNSADAVAWLVRLAKLAEKYDKPGAAEYMRQACTRCENLGRADCSGEGLRLQTERLDAIALSQLTARTSQVLDR